MLGLDGATLDLVLPLAQKGFLPNFSRLLRSSCFGKLSSLPPITPAGWTSIITGVNCGKHGLADFFRIDPETYQLRPISRLDRRVRSIYNILSDRGKTVGLVNYPITYPAEKVNGWMVTGMMTPRVDERCTFPPRLFEELEKNVGPLKFMAHSDSGKDPAGFLESIKELTRSRHRLMLYFLKNLDFDLLCCVFMGTDIVSHHFWKYMDEDHPLHGEIPVHELRKYRNAIREIFVQIDSHLGELLEELAGTDTAIVLVSDHGSGPLHGYIDLNRFLMKYGYLKKKEKGRELGKPREIVECKEMGEHREIGKPREMGKLMRALSLFIEKRRGKKGKVEMVEEREEYFKGVEWAGTKAYSWGNLSSITLNLKGREGSGTVEGEEVASVKKEIASLLMKLEDDNGEKIIESVHFSEDIFSGPEAKYLPDIYVMARGTTYIGRGIDPDHNQIDSGHIFTGTEPFSGTHRVHGLYAISDICTRKRIVKRAQVLKINGPEYRVFDIAPTILHLLGEKPPDQPENFDGKLMSDVFLP